MILEKIFNDDGMFKTEDISNLLLVINLIFWDYVFPLFFNPIFGPCPKTSEKA